MQLNWWYRPNITTEAQPNLNKKHKWLSYIKNMTIAEWSFECSRHACMYVCMYIQLSFSKQMIISEHNSWPWIIYHRMLIFTFYRLFEKRHHYHRVGMSENSERACTVHVCMPAHNDPVPHVFLLHVYRTPLGAFFLLEQERMSLKCLLFWPTKEIQVLRLLHFCTHINPCEMNIVCISLKNWIARAMHGSSSIYGSACHSDLFAHRCRT